MSKYSAFFYSEKNLIILGALILVAEILWLTCTVAVYRDQKHQETIELVKQALGKAERLRLQNIQTP